MWTLKLVGEVTGDNEDRGGFFSYQPKNDYLFSLEGTPRISVELCSDPVNESDLYRVLLQSGLLVRTMNTIIREGDSFVAVAIYITRQLSAQWYLVYQPYVTRQQVGAINSWIEIVGAHSFYRSGFSSKRLSTLNHHLASSNSFINFTTFLVLSTSDFMTSKISLRNYDVKLTLECTPGSPVQRKAPQIQIKILVTATTAGASLIIQLSPRHYLMQGIKPSTSLDWKMAGVGYTLCVHLRSRFILSP